MRINVYSQELTEEVIALEKKSNTGIVEIPRHASSAPDAGKLLGRVTEALASDAGAALLEGLRDEQRSGEEWRADALRLELRCGEHVAEIISVATERDAARALNAEAARAIRVLLGGGVSYCPGDMVRLCDKLEAK